ncbi:nucleotide pyrophosphohydrolase [Candidatus Thorarchaeota archaeon]|nr:MAG: nucleotide pyrophosphohydrolase [Candidatus Thorarchaeota archaeon]
MTQAIRKFVNDRQWQGFQKPNALAQSIAIETGELLELFQWLREDEIEELLLSDKYVEALSDEIADILIYALRLADVIGIDASKSIKDKMKKNEQKYPQKDWAGRIPDKITKNE